MNQVTTIPLHGLFGAEIAGADPADPGATREFVDAVGKWGLVLVRDVGLDDAGLARFAARFGPLQNMSGRTDARRDVIHVGNLGDDGRMKAADDANRIRHDANLLWHMDSSFLTPGATYSFLHGHIIPAEGGDTEFFDARVAWEALDADRQGELAGLTADHSMLHSWRLVGVEMPDVSRAKMPPTARKLVRRHPPSGRGALIIPSHVEQVEGLDYDQSQALVGELMAVAAAPERIYRHRWREGDLLIWDNRCILHRATPYRAFEEPRDLSSCRVLDLEDDGLAACA